MEDALEQMDKITNILYFLCWSSKILKLKLPQNTKVFSTVLLLYGFIAQHPFQKSQSPFLRQNFEQRNINKSQIQYVMLGGGQRLLLDAQHIPKSLFPFLLRTHLLQFALTYPFANAHGHLSLRLMLAQRVFQVDIMEQEDMLYDALDAVVVLDHLLVVAAALIGRPRAYAQTNHLVYFEHATIFLGGRKELSVVLQEPNILHVFLQRPQGFIESPFFASLGLFLDLDLIGAVYHIFLFFQGERESALCGGASKEEVLVI